MGRLQKRRVRLPKRQVSHKTSLHSKVKRPKLKDRKSRSKKDVQDRVKTADLGKMSITELHSSSDEEGPSQYEQFMKSLSEDLQKKNIHINVSKYVNDNVAAVDDDDEDEGIDETDGDDEDGVDGEGVDKLDGDDEEDNDVECVDEDDGGDVDDGAVSGDGKVERSECDDSDDRNMDVTRGETESIEYEKKPDPFRAHFQHDLSETDVDNLSQVFCNPLHYQHSQDPVLGGVGSMECLSSRTSRLLTPKRKSLTGLYIKKRLSDVWSASKDAGFSPLQEKIFSIIASYKDLLFARRTFGNGEEIRRIYLLHSLNHILKTRSTIMKNKARLSREGKDMDVARDQGLTRPKVLILVPFREAARQTVDVLISLLFPKAQGVVNNRKRFYDEFKEHDYIKPKISKPASFEMMFKGNIDDCFRVGITVKKKVINLYSNFYSSDLIIASPLGLRTVIGADGEKARDYDFLSSLELVIIDQADVYVMQNWDHMLHLFDHTFLQPKDSHGVDFSRVRMWCLNGWNKFYCQTLIFTDFLTPEMNSLFGTRCKNFAGRMCVFEANHIGTLSKVSVHLAHVFRKFSCSSHKELPAARLQYFIDHILSDFTGDLMRKTLILLPSFLDFIQIRNLLTKMDVNFVSLNEYTKTANISRARTNFFHGKTQFLLYTERLHFFRRFRLRGIHHIIFYSLPNYAEFYPELVNLLEEAPVGEITCTVMYSHYDSLTLNRVVGTKQAQAMLNAQDTRHTLYTTM